MSDTLSPQFLSQTLRTLQALANGETGGILRDVSAGAQKAKNFLLLHTSGALSTLSASHAGYPFGSIVPYDVDPQGRLVIYISRLSEHYKNLTADNRASLLVLDPFGTADPQSYGRAAVLTKFEQIAGSETDAAAERYFARFPQSSARSLAHDFLFFRGAPERIRWIGGFGDIRWIESATYASCPFDEICYRGMPIIEHMNEDHQEALRDLCSWRGEEGSIHMMSGLDSRGMSIAVRERGVSRVLEFPFDLPVRTPEEVRQAILRLLDSARQNRS